MGFREAGFGVGESPPSSFKIQSRPSYIMYRPLIEEGNGDPCSELITIFRVDLEYALGPGTPLNSFSFLCISCSLDTSLVT